MNMDETSAGVLVFTSSFPHAGNPVNGTFIRDFARSVCPDRRTVVLAPRCGGASAVEEQDGFRVRRFYQCCPPGRPLAGNPGGILPALKRHPLLWAFLPFFLVSELAALIRCVKREKISIIHAHWLVPQGFVGAVYKRFFNPGVKLVITCHGSDVNKTGGGLLNACKRFALKSADRVVAVSGDLAEKVRRLCPETPCQVQAMGVDTERFAPQAAAETPKLTDEFHLKSAPVLFVGSLIALKGVRDLIAAWRTVADAVPDAELLIVGSGELKPELEQLSRDLHLAERIHFSGSVPHDRLPRYFAQSAAFVLPSYSEGFGLVVFEALSCGTPVVVSELPVFTSAPNAAQLFDFCRPGDRDSIAAAVLRQLRKPMRGESGCRYVREHFSLRQTAETYLALYRELEQAKDSRS